MQHSTVQTETKWRESRRLLPTSTSKLLGVLSVLIGVAIIASFVFVWSLPAINVNPVLDNPKTPLGSALGPSAADRNNDLTPFERNTQNLAKSASPEAFPALLQSLKQNPSPSERGVVLMALKDAPPTVVPVLIAALNDSDPSLRAGAAQVLGMRHEFEAMAALSAATRDLNANVRREAVTSLGSVGAWEALPRLEQLQVSDPDYFVRLAAIGVKASLKIEIAQAIGVLAPALRDVSVTTGDAPRIYAVTTSNLYLLTGIASWTLVSRLPDAPLSVATGADPTLIYLATVNSGLYRSLDSGATWDQLEFGLQTPTQLTVTAIAVDPRNSRQVYVALASRGTGLGLRDPLGISVSKDGGATWWSLDNSPAGVITSGLVIDPQQPGYLFGITSDTPWRYTLPAQ